MSIRLRYSICRIALPLLLLAATGQATAQDKVRESFLAIQKQVAAIQPKLVETTVALTVPMGKGSGVLISSDGYVMTAGHVSGQPDQVCWVTLADGRRFRARTLGFNMENDFGLVKIDQAEGLPVAPLGDSSTLRSGQWVLAVGHPLGRHAGRPAVVRIGRVRTNSRRRMNSEPRRIMTDAPLILGDSGGPLFDLNGRVIGINSMISGEQEWGVSMHSAINPAKGALELLKKGEFLQGPQGRPETFTKPLDDGKAALQAGELADAISYFKTCESIDPTDASAQLLLAHAFARNGKPILAAERVAKSCELGFSDANLLRTDPDFSSLATNSLVSRALARLDLWNGIPGERKAERAFLAAAANVAGRPELGTVDVQLDGKEIALGIVMSTSGDVLTKASELKEGAITCLLSDGKMATAEIRATDLEWDVALLKVKAAGLRPAELSELSPSTGWVFTPDRTGSFVAAGFVGVAEMPVRDKGIGRSQAASAFMGVRTEDLDPPALRSMGLQAGIRLIEVTADFPAERAGLRTGDVIFELDGKPVDTSETLVSYLANRKPGDAVSTKVVRGPDKLNVSVTLTKRPPDVPSGVTLPLIVSGEVSRMSGPFQRVFQHDTVLRPDAIGGPLFDLSGKCVGMNIARADRTSTYAIEPRDIREIYSRLKSQSKP